MHKLVLEEDGTEIDDDDILQELSSKTFIALGEGEKWTTSTPPILGTELAVSTDTSESLDDAGVLDKPLPIQGPNNQYSDNSSRIFPNGLPAPNKLQLPDLSPSLQLALQTGQRTSSLFNQTLKECEIFYVAKFPDMTDSAHYQSIGKQMVAKFPCLAFADGKNPWSFFVAKLSQRIRTNRFMSSAKSKRPVGDTDGVAASLTPKKRFRMGAKTSNVADGGLCPEDFECHLVELRKEWEGKQSVAHIRMLLKQTHQQRRNWQSNLNPGKFGLILQKFPCFEEGSFILHEFFLMKNSDPDQARDQFASRMECVMRHVASTKRTEWEGTEAMKSVDLLMMLEKAVPKNKGKGVKSKSCIKVVMDTKSVETLPKRHLESVEEDAPKLVVFLDADKNVLCQYIIGDNVSIFAQTQSVLDAVLLLLACYYVFDLEYPTVYCQMLGFLQNWVIGHQFTGPKTSNWITFSDELARSKCME